MILKFLRSRTCLQLGASHHTEDPLNVAVKLILRCGSAVHGGAKDGMIFNGDRSRTDQYLQAVDEILRRWKEPASISAEQSRAVHIAMARLGTEFQIILTSLTGPAGANSRSGPESWTCSSSVTDSTTDYEDYQHTIFSSTKIKEAIEDLHNIAERMSSAGHIGQCIEVYRSVRKSFLDASFRRLEIRELGIDDLRVLEREALQAKMRQWMRAAKVCVRILFASEQRLCEQIFRGLGSVDTETCFSEMVRDVAIQLFRSGETISIFVRRRPRSDMLFKILDLYNGLSNLMPLLDNFLHSESLEPALIQAVEMFSGLAEAARVILPDFAHALLGEQSNFLDQSGTIHSLTTYVMNYIAQIAVYKDTLAQLIVLKPEVGMYSGDLSIRHLDLAGFEWRGPLAVQLIWIIHILQFKLEVKSKGFEDASLSQVFMINNFHCIVKKINESPKLKEIIGEDYLDQHLTRNVRRLIHGYQRSTWGRVCRFLTDEGKHLSRNLSFGTLRSAAKERFKSFNAMFEEVHRTHASWLVPDPLLREEFRLHISEELIPAYSSFLERFRSHLGGESQRGKYSKYSVEDIRTMISNFFEGGSVHHQQR